jgi:hypothetical protein
MPAAVHLDIDGSESPARSPSADDVWFDREYPRIVGVVRRVLDPHHRTAASLVTAEELGVEAFSRVRRRRSPGTSDTTRVLQRALSACMEALVGHPGTVPVPRQLQGLDDSEELSLNELQEVMGTMRVADRHSGLLVLAAGYSPTDAAMLLQLSPVRVVRHVERVATRIADARSLGLYDSTDAVATPEQVG